MILGNTIQDRLRKVVESIETFTYDFDIRYMQKWINKHPQCFPKFMLNGNYEAYFNGDKMRWEISNTKSKQHESMQRYKFS